MKKQILLFILIFCVMSSTKAEQQDAETLSEPTVEMVTSIYEYCVSQLSEEDDEAKSKTLKCVNNDLASAFYITFTSYQAMIAFISSDEGE